LTWIWDTNAVGDAAVTLIGQLCPSHLSETADTIVRPTGDGGRPSGTARVCWDWILPRRFHDRLQFGKDLAPSGCAVHVCFFCRVLLQIK
jgi:hypothetical protein